MALHVFWPACAILTLCVVGVIMYMLKSGSRLCRLRHQALPDENDWEGRSYTRELSVSVE